MIVFCHLLNDSSGSPRVLNSTISALGGAETGNLLYVGSQGRGVLENAEIDIRRYWYHRGGHRVITLITYALSQFNLYRALSRARDIPRDAVIYVNTLLPIGAALWGKRHGHQVVVHIHEVSISPVPLRWVLTRCVAWCADQLFYVSADHRNRLPITGPKSEVIPNPISPALMQRAQTPAEQHPEQPFTVLMLASLRPYKGVSEFMQLAASLKHRDDIRFNLVLNEDPNEVAIFSRRHSSANNVTLHARTDDPATFYESADLLLNLSRVDQWIETFGLTLAEAMAFGIPVIAPPIGGPAEIVTEGQEGHLIDSRDGDALQAAVLSLVDDRERASAMSSAARKRAKDFTFERYAEQLTSILALLKRNDNKV